MFFACSLAVVAVWAIQAPAGSSNLEEWKRSLEESNRFYEQGRIAEAIPVMERAVHQGEHFGPLDPRLPITLNALGYLNQLQSNYAEAARLFLRAIHLWEKIGPAYASSKNKSVDNLIGTYMASQKYDLAKKLLEVRVPEAEAAATDRKDRATLLNARAALAEMKGHHGEAERLYRESLKLWEQEPGKDGLSATIVLTNLSYVFITTKHYQKALELELRALNNLEALDATARPAVIRTLDTVATLLAKVHRIEDARQYFLRALQGAREVFGPEHPYTGQILLRYAAVLHDLHQTSEAKLIAAEGRSIAERNHPRQDTVDILDLRMSVR